MPGYRQVFEQAMKRGQGHVRQKAWDKAAVEFQRALAEFPDDMQALGAAAAALINLNRPADALLVLGHAHQVSPDDAATLEQLASLQEQMGKPLEAAQSRAGLAELFARQPSAPAERVIEQWARACQLAPDSIELRQKLALAYQQQNQFKLAVGELIAVVRLYRQRGDIDQAAAQCRAALALDPRNTDALKLMGEIRIERGTGSLPPLPEAPPAASEPNSTTADLGPAPAAANQGAHSPVDLAAQRALADLAEFIFDEQAVLQPRAGARGAAAHMTKDDLDALVGQAIDLHTRGQNEQAIAVYQRILDAVDLPAARFNLGFLYERELRFDDAAAQFEQSVQEPEYALGCHYALGECYRARGRTDAALEHFVRVLELVDLATVRRDQTDELAGLYENLAAQYNAGDPERAAQFTNQIVEFLSSPGWEEHVNEARQRLNTLATDGAPIISLAEMLTVPNMEAVLQSLGQMHQYTRQGKTYSALEEAYTALGHAPSYLPMHRRIGDILWEGGLQEAAIAKYQTIADTYQARGDTHQSMAIYQRILTFMPMDVQLRGKLIDLHLSHKEYDRALEQYVALADTYYQLADLDTARDKYQEAMKHVPRAADSKRWAQQILHKVGDLDMQRVDWRRSVQDYEQIKAIIPDDDKARLTLVELRFKINDAPRAIKELDELLVMYNNSGRAAKIIPTLEEQVSAHPNEMGLRMRLGRAYLGAGLTTQAVEQLDALGDLQLQAGLNKEAAATIRGIIALNPPNVAQYRQILSQLSPS
jgi:tetratricopeptide (TPR) repeat protein